MGTYFWRKVYDEPRSILETEQGFIVGGVSNSPVSGTKRKEGFGGYDLWILELDTKGNLLNEHVFGGENDDDFNEILIAENNEGYIITGSTYSESGTGNLIASAEKDSDFLLIYTDAHFVSQKQYTYDLKGSEILTSTTLTNSKDLLLSGYKTDEKTGKKSYVSVQVDDEGEIVWDKELSTDGDDLLRKAVVTRDGGFVFAGNSTGRNAQLKRSVQGRNDYWVVKLNTQDKEKQPEIKIEA